MPVIVDNTVATPALLNPIEYGADIVVHSATKFLNGHSDVIAGALVAADDDGAWKAVRRVRYHSGAILGPFEAWLLIRGMRTLHVRLERSCSNAMSIARHFQDHEKIGTVLYPGLTSDPGHALATRQWNTAMGYTGMLSLRVKTDVAGARRLAAAT